MKISLAVESADNRRPLTANDSYGQPWECVHPRRGASEKGDTVWNVLWICVAGAIGMGARYLIALWAAQRLGSAFPHGTLIVNLIGCFAAATLIYAALILDWTPTVGVSAVIMGSDRTGTQDVTFFIDQLVELAVRALSPGINDPATARLCIDRLEQALCHLSGREIPSAERYDDDGRVRVVACPVTFREVVESAFDEIARYGRSSVSVTCRLLQAVSTVGSCVKREIDRSALLREATVVAAGACGQSVCGRAERRPNAHGSSRTLDQL